MSMELKKGLYRPDIYVALGSNLGDCRSEIRLAFDFLKSLEPRGWSESSIWISSPVGCPPGSGDFHNAVAGLYLDMELSAMELLLRLQDYERQRGRISPAVPNSPRTIDLDILYFRNECRNDPELTLPHPRAVLRRFVMEPLAEIAPDLKLEAGMAPARIVAARLRKEAPEQRMERL
ncbi:MAG: 2-amino-4-hydroxy-6-hydroxymethyldihydropteridine diphosphokinase [Limisphaerales bacterium]|jgi:2-amino-4-hydroxy-6-hydroxymethyldihydropteridine diphosphokinase|nr:2-amino-4-hydroxy-6-hydroxymethyldihydropteridine diphosphokinase [Verrucomicrobiota bacterium]